MVQPRPILTLDFAAGRRIDRRLAFTRGSPGIRLTQDGRLRAAPAGQPRLDAGSADRPSGLMLEPSSSNLLPHGTGLDWADCPPTTDSVEGGVAAPDGSLTAQRITAPSAVSLHRVRLAGHPGPGPYTGSLYVRPAGGSGLRVQLFCYDRGAYPLNGRALIDLRDGVLLPGSSAGASLSGVGDGWLRVAITAGRPLDGTAVFLLSVTDTDPDDGGAVDVWGAQLEAGPAAGSLIPTAAAAGERAADACSLPLALVRGWSAAEGTLLLEGAVRVTTGAPQTLGALTDGTGSTGLALRVLHNGAVRACTVADGTEDRVLMAGTVAPDSRWRAAVAWRMDGLAACLDGGAVRANGVGPPPGLTTLHLGGRAGAEPANACIGRVALYRQRLPDAILQRLTRP